jgi:hypothetical protein
MKVRSPKREKAVEDLVSLVSMLRRWQEIENSCVASCTAITAKTQNPLIRLIADIIRIDSETHKKVQQVMIDSLEKEPLSLTRKELAEIWKAIEEHAFMEKQTIFLAEQARHKCRSFVLRLLLTYLVEDEQKHDRLLNQLEDFKREIYR